MSTFADAIEVAERLFKSKMFPDVKSSEVALVKVLAGQEYGLGPVAAMSGIHIMDSKPVPAAGTLAGLVKKSGRYNYRVVEWTNTVCELEFSEAATVVGTSRFGFEDAKRAGLAGRSNWQKYPRNMLFARSVVNGIRVYCPDLVGGQVLSAEEASDMSDENVGYVPSFAQENATAPDATPITEERVSQEALIKLAQLYAASGWKEPDAEDPDATLRMQLAAVGAGNAGDITGCMKALTSAQAATVQAALAGGTKT